MKYILCQPAIKRFEWELEVCITRLKKLGIQDIVLLFAKWDDSVPMYLKEKYKVEVHVYDDTSRDKSYIPSVKPFLWMQYLEEDVSRQDESYFYLDSDVLLREVPNVVPSEGVWFASDCTSYIGIDYIDSKGSGLMESMCRVVGIDPSIIRKHRPIGGAQWIIKNPTYEYWKKVYEDSIKLYKYLSSVEAEYIRKNGADYVPIQKWTAEMWVQLWNVYHFGKIVQVVEDLDFCWPTDEVERYYKTNIFHNAGVTEDNKSLFYKGKYSVRTPFEDDLNGFDSTKATIEYVKAINDVTGKELSVMKYEVIHPFHDLQDKNKVYGIGDRFPKPANKTVSKERLEELSSNNNKIGKPVIKVVE